MSKFAIEIAEQIQKLTDRGLCLKCYEPKKIEEILLDIGYYRMGFYCHPFLDTKSDSFHADTKISTIVDLYYLDADLKYILLKYINRIELNFRTKLIYYSSITYIKDPIWFINNQIMEDKFIADFKKSYTKKFIEDNITLKRHHKKYPNDIYAPAWKTFEYLTFGSIITIYSNLKNEKLKSEIANYYGANDIKKFLSLLHTIRQIRNICAHNGVLFDYNLPQSINSIPQIHFNKGDRNSIDACIKVISYFIKCVSENRQFDLERDLKNLLHNFKNDTLIKNVIINKMKIKI